LRSVGARKSDISRVFTAETLIIGFAAGLLGVGVSYLLSLPINIIISNLSGITNIAQLRPIHAVILILGSMALTLIAGFAPARMAARKDPVEALRTE
jgi:putative ABC transport system permease protein